LAKWLESPLSFPPIKSDELHEWSENVAEYMNNTFTKKIDRPRIFKVLMTSGILLVNRKRIESQDFRITYSGEDQRLNFQLTFDKSNKNLIDNLFSEGIKPSVGLLIEESKCTNCGQPYEKCECSKMLDADVAQEIIKALPFLFWTDRPI
jgi:hypothetical protein